MLLIDRNSSIEERNVVNFLENKMVSDITFQVYDYKSKYGVQYHDITIKITLLNLGLGYQDVYFKVNNLNTWNKDVFIENITNEYKGITGVLN